MKEKIVDNLSEMLGGIDDDIFAEAYNVNDGAALAELKAKEKKEKGFLFFKDMSSHRQLKIAAVIVAAIILLGGVTVAATKIISSLTGGEGNSGSDDSAVINIQTEKPGNTSAPSEPVMWETPRTSTAAPTETINVQTERPGNTSAPSVPVETTAPMTPTPTPTENTTNALLNVFMESGYESTSMNCDCVNRLSQSKFIEKIYYDNQTTVTFQLGKVTFDNAYHHSTDKYSDREYESYRVLGTLEQSYGMETREGYCRKWASGYYFNISGADTQGNLIANAQEYIELFYDGIDLGEYDIAWYTYTSREGADYAVTAVFPYYYTKTFDDEVIYRYIINFNKKNGDGNLCTDEGFQIWYSPAEKRFDTMMVTEYDVEWLEVKVSEKEIQDKIKEFVNSSLNDGFSYVSQTANNSELTYRDGMFLTGVSVVVTIKDNNTNEMYDENLRLYFSMRE